MKLRFFRCDICGKVVAVLSQADVPTDCCGQPMRELVANTTDGAKEKHVPVSRREAEKLHVTVGSAPHPMTPAHWIEWIALQTDRGISFRALRPGDAPAVCFTVCPDEETEEVYAYCNLHGLWASPFSMTK